MSLDKIVNGDYGQAIELTFVDVDTSAAANISSYTTAKQMIFTSPSGVATTKTAAFKTDGSDGIITYTLANGDINAAGNWTVRGVVTTGSAKLSTEEHKFNVLQ